MQTKYFPENDALTLILRKGPLVDSEDVSDRVIVHYAKGHQLAEIEILDFTQLLSSLGKEPLPKSWKKAIGMFAHKKKSLDAHMKKVRAEWSRS
ncbi:MAG: DUF2283 domain-containing protein [bacterium]|nr:DUF2283 domain-containing protein [bacterium]